MSKFEDASAIVINLPEVVSKSGMKTVVSAFIDAANASESVNNYNKACTELMLDEVHAEYSVLQDKLGRKPYPTEVSKAFTAAFDTEIKSAQIHQRMPEEWRKGKKFSAMLAAYNKILGVLEHGEDIMEFSSVNQCALRTQKINEDLKVKAINDAVDRQAANMSKDTGKSVEECKAELTKKDDEPAKVQQEPAKVVGSIPLTTSTILQDKFGKQVDQAMVDMFIEQLDSVLEIASKNENMAVDMLEGFANKLTKAKQSLGIIKGGAFFKKQA